VRIPLHSRIALALLAAGLAGLTTGCIGLYDNSKKFMNLPATGTDEIDVLKEFGAPDFQATTSDRKVYTYKVRDVKYVVLVGVYSGHDLLVVVKDGKVEETRRVARPSTLAILQPIPWAVAD